MRCYNGAPDSKLQALLDYREGLRKRLPEGAHLTHFPADRHPYQVWQNRDGRAPIPISAEHDSPEAAMLEVIQREGL